MSSSSQRHAVYPALVHVSSPSLPLPWCKTSSSSSCLAWLTGIAPWLLLLLSQLDPLQSTLSIPDRVSLSKSNSNQVLFLLKNLLWLLTSLSLRGKALTKSCSIWAVLHSPHPSFSAFQEMFKNASITGPLHSLFAVSGLLFPLMSAWCTTCISPRSLLNCRISESFLGNPPNALASSPSLSPVHWLPAFHFLYHHVTHARFIESLILVPSSLCPSYQCVCVP